MTISCTVIFFSRVVSAMSGYRWGQFGKVVADNYFSAIVVFGNDGNRYCQCAAELLRLSLTLGILVKVYLVVGYAFSFQKLLHHSAGAAGHSGKNSNVF